MALTFGAATSDKVEIDMPLTLHADSAPFLVYGWWYPTTLTAGRHYWGVGQFSANFSGMRVGATTSELGWVSDFGTTDSVWETSGAGITVDKWWFIACLTNGSVGGPADGCQIWLGDAENCPTALTPTRSVAPVGAPAASTLFNIGNGFFSSANLAFQGDIADVGFVASDSYSSSFHTTHILGQAVSSGDVDAEMIGFTYDHWVKHLWANEYPYHEQGKGTSGRWLWCHWPGIGLKDIALQRGEAPTGTAIVPFNGQITVSSPTLSNRRHPRAYRTTLMIPPPLARRR